MMLEWVEDVLEQHYFKDNIFSVGTNSPELLWVDVYNGVVLERQKFLNNKPAYVGALVQDGKEIVLPLSGKFFNVEEFGGQPNYRHINFLGPNIE